MTASTPEVVILIILLKILKRWFQKTFFSAENRIKSASAVFSGLPRRVDCTKKISKFQKKFCLYRQVQSFFQKTLFGCQICSSLATGMLDTSNCFKFSLVFARQISTDVDFRFFFSSRKYSKIAFFVALIDKKHIWSLVFN